jgi:hypothetical protein
LHRKPESNGIQKEPVMPTETLHHPSSTPESIRSRRTLWSAAAMAVLVGAFFLLREHWGHVAGYWPYLLLLACPLMHLFHGHGGHGRHAGHAADDKRSPAGEE